MSLIQAAALVGTFAASVAAHGHISGVVAAGVYYEGYDPSFQYQDPAPVVIGWSDPEDLGNGFIPPSNYSTPDIICHLGATNAGASAKVAGGDVVELQWTAWPDSHHGPVLTYLAKCDGSCSTVDKTKLEFVKIDAVGLVNDATVPGTWGTDQLIANNNSWTVTIPKTIAPGNYVLRHEIIALHSAGQADGAQNYPQCINLEITGSGTATPAGTLGEKLYNENAPGIVVNIYSSLSKYVIPGPTLWSGAVSMAQKTVAVVSTAPVSSGSSTVWGASTTATAAARIATSAAAVSSPATTSAAVSAPATSSAAVSAPAATSAAAVAPVSESAAVSVPYSAPLASIASALGTGELTKTIGTALPTGTGVASPSGGAPFGGAGLGGVPSKPLPAGTTIADLLQWLTYLLGKANAQKSGRHARDFRAAQ